MLAASRSVQQQESEARQELDGLEAEREAAMQAGVTSPGLVTASQLQAANMRPIVALLKGWSAQNSVLSDVISREACYASDSVS